MKVYKSKGFVEKGKHIGLRLKNDFDVPEHRHEYIEIIYILDGHAEEYIDGRLYRVKRGDMLFINYGSTHAFYAKEGELQYFNIVFSPETVSDSIITAENAFSLLSLTAFNEMCNESDGAKVSFLGNERREVEAVLFAMRRECQEKSTSWDRVMESYLNILITKMLRKTEAGMRSKEISDVWQALSEYIDQNLDARLTLDDLAKRCFYNPSYFSRVFKEKFGTSLVEYVNRRRIERARRLLEKEPLSIDEIGRTVGFSDRSSFYRVFTKYVQCTPSEYRKRVQK